MKKKDEVIVELRLKLPHDLEFIGKQELRAFIKDALLSWGGGGHPEDPMFTSCQEVSVRKIELVKKGA